MKQQSDTHHWHNGADAQLLLYGSSLQEAARSLIANLTHTSSTSSWNAAPIVLLYTQIVELKLKALIGEGCHFLPSPTDSITLYTTHSLRWLAQIVCLIIKTLRWQSTFTCEGIPNVKAFSAIIQELDAASPVPAAVHHLSRTRDAAPPPQLGQIQVLNLATRLDSLLDLLGTTTNALIAEASRRKAASDQKKLFAVPQTKPTIH